MAFKEFVPVRFKLIFFYSFIYYHTFGVRQRHVRRAPLGYKETPYSLSTKFKANQTKDLTRHYFTSAHIIGSFLVDPQGYTNSETLKNSYKTNFYHIRNLLRYSSGLC